jgi:hypothetical protein
MEQRQLLMLQLFSGVRFWANTRWESLMLRVVGGREMGMKFVPLMASRIACDYGK